MKILETEEYCCICKKRLKLGNIGAIVKDKSAQNACQEPCANTFILQQRKPVVPKPRRKIKPGGNNFNALEEIQQETSEPITPPLDTSTDPRFAVIPILEEPREAQPPEHPTSFGITESGDRVTITTIHTGSKLPLELFYEIILRNLMITKFAILKLEVNNRIGIPIRIIMKQNTNDDKLAYLHCDSSSFLDYDFIIPYINDNDLVIEFTNAGNSIYNNAIFIFNTKLTIKILERGE